MKSYILLENVEFYAYHGVMDQETRVGNVFVVNMKVELDILPSTKTDELSDTVSYAEIFESINDEMKKPGKLLEHVAYRIIQRLRNDYENMKTIELKLSKRNPPIGGAAQVEYASVLLIDEK